MAKYFTEDHEWISIEGSTATVGITKYAQDQLGDIVYVDLPDIDDEFSKGDDTAVVESVKAAGDITAPASGKVVEINEVLADDSELVSKSPEGEGWLYKLEISDEGELSEYMNEESYKEFLKDL